MTAAPEFVVAVPTRGDGARGDWGPGPAPRPAFLTDLRDGAYGPFDHLAQIGRAAEIAGFHGVSVPFDPAGEESLVVTAGLLRQSRWLRGTAGFHPGVATPVYAAKVAASLQRFTGGRLDWRLAIDLDPAVARAQGDFAEGAERYARADEFLTIARGVWHEDSYTYEGRYFQVLAGGFQAPLSDRPFPRVHLSGTSAEALDLSARHADVHLFDAADAAGAAGAEGGGLGALIADLGARAAGYGRAVASGLVLPVLAREDGAEVRAEVARRAAAGSPVPALAGSYEEVAAVLRGHLADGVTTFVLEAAPHLEETYRLGEHLLPLITEEVPHAG
ncbi:LLM class flavin-dependent oxidoreductase [Actinomadura xylanilytica]|uniref:LLM class flavin-dependent oxidoreductase n=1 Tax=Actinomadura xylanilytica TaxID=887459 RepID=UPI00255AE477|nr:LLM class flavin-dependent oxidoreductase [Actinomadura xylanilytica]MDL4776490.1 LLM class flavin-dependent oxidoreductase [Actinomadura xylanilytica]